MIAAWILFPLVLAAVCLGCGLLAERAAATRVRGTLLLPLGLALAVVITQATTYWDATAELSAPLLVAATIAGLVLGRERLVPARVCGWAVAAAGATFVAYGAPVFLSGDATFAGYTLLGDSSIHFVIVDRIMDHGRSLSGLAPSSYQRTLEAYLDTGYPLGAHSLLGTGRALTGQEVAWVFQPYIAFIAALISLTVFELLRDVVRSPVWRALAALVAAQPALLYAFGLQGSVKEIAAILVIALLAALVPALTREDAHLRAVIPLAVVAAAGLGVLGLAILPWLALVLLAGVVVALRAGAGGGRLAVLAAALTAITAALAFPSVLEARSFLRGTQDVITAASEVGNLEGPLNLLQAFGIWPVSDYRFAPDGAKQVLAYLLLAVAVVSCAVGVAFAVKRRAGALLAYVAATLGGCAFVIVQGSPWADAKALAIAAPALAVAAMAGVGALLDGGRRTLAALVLVALAAGVLWSNALAYRGVRLAPRDRLAELDRIDGRIAGEGPTLYTEFEEFGKHFLRSGAPTGSSEAWQPASPTGEYGRYGYSHDVDFFSLAYLTHYRTIVLRRSPSLSRPPSAFARTFRGRFYEVWQQRPGRAIARHLPLGDAVQPSARPDCAGVAALAAAARREGGDLAFVPRPRSLVVPPNASATVPESGPYAVWLPGSFGRGFDVRIDGGRLGTVRYELNPPGQYAYVATAVLPRGRHQVGTALAGVSLRPGNASGTRRVRAVVLSPDAADTRAVRRLPPSRYRSLCARDLDWIELVAKG